MDRLKSAASSGMDRAKNMKPSFSSSGDQSSGSSITGLGLRNKGRSQVAGWMGKESPSPERQPARPIRELRDPASFPPPPKRRTSYDSPEAPSPPEGGYSVAKKPPPVPPRLPPRQGSFPEPKAVTDEEVRTTGGLNSGALSRLGASGVSVQGFGIGRSASSSANSSPPPLRPGLGGLGDKFGKLSTSDSHAAPASGTSFAEKQAAVKTANNFYKNPNSVSFSDGLAAAKTARNFQQRHGDQVATGMRAAQSMDEKYGVSDRLGTVSVPPPNISATSTSSPTLPPRPCSSSPLSNGPGIRKPPPLPPKKKPQLPPKRKPDVSPATSRPPPPPVPLSTRPSFSPPSVRSEALPNCGLPISMISELPQDLDLALSAPWFASNPLQLPRSIASIKDKTYAMSTSWTRNASGRTKHTLIIALRYTLNLSTTKIKITWDASLPTATVCATQRHFPPPAPLPAHELEGAALRFGQEVVSWAQSQIGRQVGDGECWTLAHDALAATPGAMVSQGYTHGACIFSFNPPAEPPRSVVPLQPGDILQFWRAKWETRDAMGRVTGSKSAGDPDHTAVVVEARGDTVEVLEQNVGGVKRVQPGEYRLGGGIMREGRVRAFRPVGAEYGSFNAEWED